MVNTTLIALALFASCSSSGCAPAVAGLQAIRFQSPKAAKTAAVEGYIDIGEFSEVALAPVRRKVRARVAAGDRVLLFRINSYGGSVSAGVDLIHLVEEQKKRGVRIQCAVDQKAMSMGFVFLQAVCDERWMTKRAVLLAHNSSVSRASGNAEELSEIVDTLRALDDAMADICADRMRMPVHVYKAKIAARSWVFGWREALAVRAIDRVVDPNDLPPAF